MRYPIFFTMTQRNNTNHLASKLVSYFTSLMAILYLAGGVYLLTSTEMKEQFGASFCTAIGLGLIAYGIFRIYRAVQFWKYGE